MDCTSASRKEALLTNGDRIEPPAPRHHDLIVIGGSAGSFEPLRELLSKLPLELPAAVLIVVHTADHGATPGLGRVLSSYGKLPVYDAQDGESIRPGEIYVAVPDYHLLVHQGLLLLRRGPRENFVRPAIDALFRSAAVEFGGRVISVVLSGEGSDGTDGMKAVRRCGGVGIVQLPALHESMPIQARDVAQADETVDASSLAAAILARVEEPAGFTPSEIAPDLIHQVLMARQDQSPMNGQIRLPTALACPRCDGPLWEVRDGKLVKYECEIGHAFAPEEVDVSQRFATESALWTAVRMNEERARFNRHQARVDREGGRDRAASRWEARVTEYEAQAELLRRLILSAYQPTSNN